VGGQLARPSADQFECLPGSTLPAEIAKAGYRLEPASPAEGQRIVANAMVEDVLTEGSTRTTIRTVREGIVRVVRFAFLI